MASEKKCHEFQNSWQRWLVRMIMQRILTNYWHLLNFIISEICFSFFKDMDNDDAHKSIDNADEP